MQNTNQTLQENNINQNIPVDLFMSDDISPTLARLIEEVKNDSQSIHAYDRAHNRHNR